MSIEESLYSALTASTLVTAYTSNRVYPVWVDQETAYPFISYFRLASQPVYSFDGHDTSLTNAFIQVDLFTTSYAISRTLRDNVLAAVDSSTLVTARLQNDNDLFETEDNTDRKVYRVSMDFSMWG